MKKLYEKYLYACLGQERYRYIKKDVLKENRQSLIIYSLIVLFGMSLLLFLSLFVPILVSSRTSYTIAIISSIIIYLHTKRMAKKYIALIYIFEYLFICLLLAFGIYLGTFVEPNQASTSFAILIFVAPLLFTDLPIKINTLTILGIIIYTILAKQTQNSAIFGFNMSVIMPYGISNLLLTYIIMKIKLERVYFAKENKHLSEVDQLTNLYNRRSFEKDAEHLRKNGSLGYSVCSFDVNGLKAINDTLGHKYGDELLCAASNTIEKVFGEYGKCYRVGGDEFMALIVGKHPSDEELINKLNELAKAYQSENIHNLSISSGIAFDDSKDIDELIIIADKKMYKNKNEHYISSGIDRRTY